MSVGLFVSTKIRTLTDILQIQEDVQEDWGWKLVHGEVFRQPSHPMLLGIMSGNGAQLCSMVGVTLGLNIYVLVSLFLKCPLHSVCVIGVPFSFKPWFFGHRDDGVLLVLRMVRSYILISHNRSDIDVLHISIGGYVSSRVYSSLGGSDKRKNAFLTATGLPTCVLLYNAKV